MGNEKGGCRDPRVHDAIQMLLARPTLRIGSVAAAVGLSPSRLHHVASVELGVSLKRFVRARLVALAAESLRGSLDVKAIRFDAGFRDPSAFCRAFKRQYGVCPTRYRSSGMSRGGTPDVQIGRG